MHAFLVPFNKNQEIRLLFHFTYLVEIQFIYHLFLCGFTLFMFFLFTIYCEILSNTIYRIPFRNIINFLSYPLINPRCMFTQNVRPARYAPRSPAMHQKHLNTTRYIQKPTDIPQKTHFRAPTVHFRPQIPPKTCFRPPTTCFEPQTPQWTRF